MSQEILNKLDISPRACAALLPGELTCAISGCIEKPLGIPTLASLQAEYDFRSSLGLAQAVPLENVAKFKSKFKKLENEDPYYKNFYNEHMNWRTAVWNSADGFIVFASEAEAMGMPVPFRLGGYPGNMEGCLRENLAKFRKCLSKLHYDANFGLNVEKDLLPESEVAEGDSFALPVLFAMADMKVFAAPDGEGGGPAQPCRPQFVATGGLDQDDANGGEVRLRAVGLLDRKRKVAEAMGALFVRVDEVAVDVVTSESGVAIPDKTPYTLIPLRISQLFGTARQPKRERPEGVAESPAEDASAWLGGGGFCSVLPGRCDNFVGRATNLLDLRNLLDGGKHPVVQAGGGVGKTELAVAYTCESAGRYPMGRFLFRMEGARSWDDVFASALSANGNDGDGRLKMVVEELGLDIKEFEKMDPREKHRAAAKALLERAARGRLLVLLDNLDEDTDLVKYPAMHEFLCGSAIPVSMHILATTRGTFHFGARDRFCSYELDTLKEDECLEMMHLAGNGRFPFDGQQLDAGNAEYQAALGIIRFVECNALWVEILSGMMAEDYDPEEFSFVILLEALRRGDIPGGALNVVGTWRGGGGSAVGGVLCQRALDNLAGSELGAESLELAVFASLFDADEIPVYLLREYWRLNFPNATCSRGVIPFNYALSKLVGRHLLRRSGDTCRMHRLIQSVLQSREKERYLPRIVKTLPECSFIPERLWVRLLSRNPELAGAIPQEWALKPADWVELLQNQPRLADWCPWQSFFGHNWVSLLIDCPQFAKKCDWYKLDRWDWVKLLCKQPQFADKCNWWSRMSGKAWEYLLCEQPKFANKCDWYKLDGWDWVELLCEQPQFADKCDWGKIFSWGCLLCEQPQFADRCDWSKLSGSSWKWLLMKQPQFADKCDWGKLDGEDWSKLLSEQPQFADKCDWGKIFSWGCLLCEQPRFADRCDWSKLSGSSWKWLLMKQPQFADKCDWGKLDGEDWAKLLSEQPQFADKCDWSKLDGEDWANLLKEQPRFADKCDWSKLDRRDCLDARNWAYLLIYRPQFAEKCNWGKLDGGDWVFLLQKQPQFTDRCDWSKLDVYQWVKLLEKQPQLVDQYDLDRLNGKDWSDLLKEQPQFAKRCDWSKLDGKDWAWLLMYRPQFAEKCDWGKLDGGNWASLLREQPRFAEKCDWGKLDGGDWVWLLEGDSQFAEKCDWSKLNGKNWSDLLSGKSWYTQFVEKCDWWKLEEKDWANLLEKCPQFCDIRKVLQKNKP